MYSTAEICRLTGLSYRQLDYWIRSGYLRRGLSGDGSGSRRRWTQADLDRVLEIRYALDRAVAILDAAGLPGRRWLKGGDSKPRLTDG